MENENDIMINTIELVTWEIISHTAQYGKVLAFTRIATMVILHQLIISILPISLSQENCLTLILRNICHLGLLRYCYFSLPI
jgi:hypothetical protein